MPAHLSHTNLVATNYLALAVHDAPGPGRFARGRVLNMLMSWQIRFRSSRCDGGGGCLGGLDFRLWLLQSLTVSFTRLDLKRSSRRVFCDLACRRTFVWEKL